MLRFEVVVEESDLLVIVEACDEMMLIKDFAYEVVETIRAQLKAHIRACPDFLVSLEPLTMTEVHDELIIKMYEAAEKANVGPMAAVAGITSETLGKALMGRYGFVDLLIENGGDIFVNGSRDKQIAVYAGDSPLSGQVAIKLKAEDMPLGVCTSAGTVGHSLSFGKADAVVVVSKDTALADAVATSIGNRVHSDKDIEAALNDGMAIEGVMGILIIVDQTLGAKGRVELV